ncbi:hypothetical protein C9374_006349 [Naegleria lovaniensis]|uniref:F-box domain-containing protein n=1 Tax=Naegleria lovaniensis TaxID=51637 RepID=A0AA88GNV0_NAELO|nr:uncharacterized protein C9374_006349 [Naegleria lovaniensis]KAG2381360.1 hypothetical protein C9374_006349 [Naegleria lovaniensis]
MGQSPSFTEDADSDIQQFNNTPSNTPVDAKVYSSLYLQTSKIELTCSEDLFGPVEQNIWANLPLDAIRYIFEFLSFRETFTVSVVCKKFNALCWKHLKEIDICKESTCAAQVVTDNILLRVIALATNIESLSLYGCRLLTNTSLSAIVHQSETLTSLDLSYTPRLSSETLNIISKKCTKLKRLVLGGMYSYQYGDVNQTSTNSFIFPNLEIFVHRRAQDFGSGFISYLKNHEKTLKGINLEQPQIIPHHSCTIVDSIFSNETFQNNLVFLNLDGMADHVMQLRQLTALAKFKNLQGLTLSTLGQNLNVAETILTGIGNNLKYFVASRMDLSDEFLEILLKVGMKEVKILSLSHLAFSYGTAPNRAQNVKQILKLSLQKKAFQNLVCFEYSLPPNFKDEELGNLVSQFKELKMLFTWRKRLGFEDY